MLNSVEKWLCESQKKKTMVDGAISGTVFSYNCSPIISDLAVFYVEGFGESKHSDMLAFALY
jgi:hypothetical protein